MKVTPVNKISRAGWQTNIQTLKEQRDIFRKMSGGKKRKERKKSGILFSHVEHVSA